MNLLKQPDNQMSESERKSFYKIIFSRRDVRGEFLPDAIPDDVLSRILYAAHYAPSVGFMQPWDFIVVKSRSIREQIHNVFKRAHSEAAGMFSREEQKTYRSLKLEGIMESPINFKHKLLKRTLRQAQCMHLDRLDTGFSVFNQHHFITGHLSMQYHSIQKSGAG